MKVGLVVAGVYALAGNLQGRDRGDLGTFCRWYVDQWIAASN